MVGDLGLGRALDMSSRLTMVAGTPSYVAPEQARAEAPDARADQYSLAALAYLLLAGRPAYQHLSLLDAGHPGPLPPVSTPERPFPAEVDAVLRRGLAPDREERYPDVTAFVTALEAALGPGTRRARRSPRPWLPVDPDLTQPGPRPTAAPATGPSVSTPAAAGAAARPGGPGRRGGRAAGAGAGRRGAATLVHEALEEPEDPTFTDDLGALSVTVPDGPGTRWPTTAGSRRTPRARTRTPRCRWASRPTGRRTTRRTVSSSAILPGDELPEQSPQHPECETDDGRIDSTVDGRPSTTTYYSSCPGRRHRRAGGPGRRQPAAVGAGAQRGPGDRDVGARERGHHGL